MAKRLDELGDRIYALVQSMLIDQGVNDHKYHN